MKPDKYQRRCLETWHTDRLPADLQRVHAVLGVVGESGEVAELLKKDKFKPGHESTREQRLDELGDVLYYLCVLAYLDGFTIDMLSNMNYLKLRKGHGWQPDYASEESPME